MKTRVLAKNRRKWMYGLTEEAFNAQLAAQKNQCAICDLVFEAVGLRGPHVDHDRDVHRLRGVLCFRCNLLLGYSEFYLQEMELRVETKETGNGDKYSTYTV